jgi:hypothetical protein
MLKSLKDNIDIIFVSDITALDNPIKPKYYNVYEISFSTSISNDANVN